MAGAEGKEHTPAPGARAAHSPAVKDQSINNPFRLTGVWGCRTPRVCASPRQLHQARACPACTRSACSRRPQTGRTAHPHGGAVTDRRCRPRWSWKPPGDGRHGRSQRARPTAPSAVSGQGEAEMGADRRHEHLGARSLDAWMAEHRPDWCIEVKPPREGGKTTAGVRQGYRVERKPRAARRAATGIVRSGTAASFQER
jgi:hypothetical protein